MTGFELASVANLQPETAEEAKVLIPSLDVSASFSIHDVNSAFNKNCGFLLSIY